VSQEYFRRCVAAPLGDLFCAFQMELADRVKAKGKKACSLQPRHPRRVVCLSPRLRPPHLTTWSEWGAGGRQTSRRRDEDALPLAYNMQQLTRTHQTWRFHLTGGRAAFEYLPARWPLHQIVIRFSFVRNCLSPGFRAFRHLTFRISTSYQLGDDRQYSSRMPSVRTHWSELDLARVMSFAARDRVGCTCLLAPAPVVHASVADGLAFQPQASISNQRRFDRPSRPYGSEQSWARADVRAVGTVGFWQKKRPLPSTASRAAWRDSLSQTQS
jgi:hypothetical protein